MKVIDSFKKKKYSHQYRLASSYQTELNTLFNICSKSLSDLERSICPQYQDDYDFLLGQMQFPQVGRITPVVDTADVARRERAHKRKEDRTSYYEEMRMNDSFNTSFNSSFSSAPDTSFLTTPTPAKRRRVRANPGVNTDHILDKTRARRSLNLLPVDCSCNEDVVCDTVQDDVIHDNDDTIHDNDDAEDAVCDTVQDDQADTDWAPPLRYTEPAS